MFSKLYVYKQSCAKIPKFLICHPSNVYCLPIPRSTSLVLLVKFIYSEKTTKFCEISANYLTGSTYIGQIIGGDFANFCGLLRIYELYITTISQDILLEK